MCRFARDCIQKLDELMPLLVERLGGDTKQLVMRIGLHSGPVTAGVLRGDKARFQLFGDTVVRVKIVSSDHECVTPLV